MALLGSFRLAPMSNMIRVITIGFLVLPSIFAVIGLVQRSWPFGVASLFLVVIFGAVWLWCRPLRFDIYPKYLKIVFPLWSRTITLGTVSEIALLRLGAFHYQFGFPIRLGVGGLWGGFGWLWTPKQGLLEFYVSQLDNFVVIKRKRGLTLMITPANPSQFVSVIQGLVP